MAMPSWYQQKRYSDPKRKTQGRYNRPMRASEILEDMSKPNGLLDDRVLQGRA